MTVITNPLRSMKIYCLGRKGICQLLPGSSAWAYVTRFTGAFFPLKDVAARVDFRRASAGLQCSDSPGPGQPEMTNHVRIRNHPVAVGDLEDAVFALN